LRAILRSRVVTSICFGGGTASPDCRLIGRRHPRRRARGLVVPDGIEITLEANLQVSRAGRFRGYRQAGVNRVSMGVSGAQ